jgi:hypothetical protein
LTNPAQKHKKTNKLDYLLVVTFSFLRFCTGFSLLAAGRIRASRYSRQTNISGAMLRLKRYAPIPI